MRRLLWLTLVLAACATPARYQNVLNPGFGDREFDRDLRACEGRQQRGDTQTSVSVNGLAFLSEPAVSTAGVQRCLAARGWRRVEQCLTAGRCGTRGGPGSW